MLNDSDKDFIKEQIERMGGLANFPKDTPAALREMALALMNADSHSHAAAVIDQFVKDIGTHWCPTPPDIRKAVFDSATKRENKCRACGGIGFISGDFLITRYGNRKTNQRITTDEQMKAIRANLQENQEIVAASKPCGCHAAMGNPDSEVA